jgi:hypothetical protein
MNFIIYDANGQIIRVGSVPEQFFDIQANEGEFILEGQADPSTDMIDTVTQTVIKKPIVPEQELTGDSYAELRKRMYPSTAEQLDMLWHAMDSGQTEKSEPFYTAIKTVKDTVPKTSENVFTVEGS